MRFTLRYGILALVALSVLHAPPAAAQRIDAPEKIEITARAVTGFDKRNPKPTRFGELQFIGGLVLQSKFKHFGGLSGLRKDSGLEGGPIMLADRQYPKGLSMYANGEVEYSLGGKYKELRATAGADPRMAEDGFGVTTVSIYCDGKLEWSKEVSVKTPIPIQVNVKDVQTIRIVVRGKDATGFTAHASLAYARVSQ